MNLDEYLSKFTQTTDFPTLDGMRFLMEKLNNPHKKMKFIHVAGTNGKGSICEMLNLCLIDSNYKVGKFISPHLVKSNESISINNICIFDTTVSKYIPILSNIIEEYKKDFGREFTRFEILTTIAILYFYEQKCDISILEVGLGGLYDCTNIITPLVSIFGSISFDHTAILGNTLEEIAIQKAGIIKENSNTIIFNQDALSIIEKTCKEKNNNLIVTFPSDISNYNFDKNFQYFTYKNKYDITLNLKGKKQIENAANVIECVELLNKKYEFNIKNETLLNSLKEVIHPARFEILSSSPLVIFDGAHNENAMENFIETVNLLYKNDKKTFIISIIRTKNYKTILNRLIPSFPDSKFIFTNGNNKEKFFEPTTLLNEASNILNHKNTDNLTCLNLDEALKNLDNYRTTFILGSFYTYTHVYKLFK